jgi:hypothetical protein
MECWNSQLFESEKAILSPNPDKPEIRNSKYEIRNKFLITKIQMTQTKKS